MATTAAAAKPPVEAVPEAAPTTKKKSKLLFVIVLTVALAAAGVAGAWLFLFGETDEQEPRLSSKPAVFLPIDQFTVNLQPEEGQQYLQVAMTLKVVDQAAADSIKAQMPEVRSRVLLLLSSKKPSQLVTLEGKNTLIEEIAREVEIPLAAAERGAKPAKKKTDGEAKKVKAKAKARAQDEDVNAKRAARARVLAVYFTHFIVQ